MYVCIYITYMYVFRYTVFTCKHFRIFLAYLDIDNLQPMQFCDICSTCIL